MITTTVRMPYKYGGVVKIVPVFDVHIGNIACDVNGFKKYLAAADGEYTYFIGGGDLNDSIITSDLKRYQKSSDASKVDAIIDEQVETMRDLLLPYKSKIIGSITGNHEHNILKRCGTNPTKRLCSLLDVPYLGYSCLMGLTLYDEGGSNRSVTLNLRIHHGWGGGSRTRGGSITKYEKDMGKWNADIYMYGHDHKSQVDKMPRLGRAGNKLVSQTQMLVLCGTFLKTFTENEDATYSEVAGYPPTDIGAPEVFIEPGIHSGYALHAYI